MTATAYHSRRVVGSIWRLGLAVVIAGLRGSRHNSLGIGSLDYASAPAATGTAVPGRATWFGGLDGTFPATGAAVRLVDTTGQIAHERAAMPAGTTVACAVVPDGDLTRAYVIPTVRTAGWWALTMTFARDLGVGETVLSMGGDSTAETSLIGFPVE